MNTSAKSFAREPRVLILTTDDCSYPAADMLGQLHLAYPATYYMLRTRCPVLFPEDFYLRCFARGADAILVASSGTDCPYEGAYSRLAARVDRVYQRMKGEGLDPRRLRLTAICSVCTKAFLREIERMGETLAEIGPLPRGTAAQERGA